MLYNSGYARPQRCSVTLKMHQIHLRPPSNTLGSSPHGAVTSGKEGRQDERLSRTPQTLAPPLSRRNLNGSRLFIDVCSSIYRLPSLLFSVLWRCCVMHIRLNKRVSRSVSEIGYMASAERELIMWVGYWPQWGPRPPKLKAVWILWTRNLEHSSPSPKISS